jgi:TM2 domain-containing membrane protein YozV
MTNAVKGGLLSALVFPGLGQIALKRYQRGVVLMLTVLAGLAVIVVNATRQAVRIFETIESGGGAIDRDAIARAAQAAASSDSLIINLLLVVITICWIYGIVDAYRIGKQQDLRHAGGPRE